MPHSTNLWDSGDVEFWGYGDKSIGDVGIFDTGELGSRLLGSGSGFRVEDWV